jgi:hypothetical protein
MCSLNPASSNERAARTLREELVTPPLFVDASLKRMTPAS